jgi:hypothetical protein
MQNIIKIFLVVLMLNFNHAAIAEQLIYSCILDYDYQNEFGKVEYSSPVDKNAEFSFTFQTGQNVTVGTYKNMKRGWSGDVVVLDDLEKSVLVEYATPSNNHFVVTIFKKLKDVHGMKAVLSIHDMDLHGLSRARGYCK